MLIKNVIKVCTTALLISMSCNSIAASSTQILFSFDGNLNDTSGNNRTGVLYKDDGTVENTPSYAAGASG